MSFEIGYEVAVNAVFISAFFLLAKSIPLVLWRVLTTRFSLQGRISSASPRESAERIVEEVRPEHFRDAYHMHDARWRDCLQSRELLTEAGVATFLLTVLFLGGWFSAGMETFIGVTVVILAVTILSLSRLNRRLGEVLREVRYLLMSPE